MRWGSMMCLVLAEMRDKDTNQFKVTSTTAKSKKIYVRDLADSHRGKTMRRRNESHSDRAEGCWDEIKKFGMTS